ncbi:calcium/sodium antiporter [Desulfosarcina ovata]|uniref:K+-dependent Na+/Ca+ exchanger n=1 Tax=Desulfosarcina ovata subsp. ovata TaxID=2752305 RepID=A0A5K8AKN6_9BACT|nr:calcium/sodium antiporter [Desulfosarcina ovata]BBO93261.1 K+-dependent Na+/Ca+ exchanger [Desulfosarcina ovata subsp. ovata]
MIVILFLLMAGFVVLIKGADIFVDGAAHLARTLDVSPMIIGLTVVAFGTSVPELFVNIAASVGGDTDIALGNVMGSNIANGLLVLGISALIRPLQIFRKTVWQAIPFSLLAAIMLWVLANDVFVDGSFFSILSRSDGWVLLGFFTVFMAYSAAVIAPVDGLPPVDPVPPEKAAAVALKMAFGFCGLLFGSRWIVDSAVALADRLGAPRVVVGLTVVALGTSLPELATSVAAARRGAAEIAVGNVVGSNIFNILFVLGISAVIRPLPVNPAANMDLAMLTATSVLLVVFLFAGQVRVMGRREGGLALFLYVLYTGYLVYPLFF